MARFSAPNLASISIVKNNILHRKKFKINHSRIDQTSFTPHGFAPSTWLISRYIHSSTTQKSCCSSQFVDTGRSLCYDCTCIELQASVFCEKTILPHTGITLVRTILRCEDWNNLREIEPKILSIMTKNDSGYMTLWLMSFYVDPYGDEWMGTWW